MHWLLAYIGGVVVINYCFSVAPHLDFVWSCAVGFTYILRDMVQVRYGHWSLLAMAVATVASYLTSDPVVALASVSAFAAAELIDWLVFTITRRPLRDRLWISGLASAPFDTAIFFGMLDIWDPTVWALSIFSKLIGVSVIWTVMKSREQRKAVAA